MGDTHPCRCCVSAATGLLFLPTTRQGEGQSGWLHPKAVEDRGVKRGEPDRRGHREEALCSAGPPLTVLGSFSRGTPPIELPGNPHCSASRPLGSLGHNSSACHPGHITFRWQDGGISMCRGDSQGGELTCKCLGCVKSPPSLLCSLFSFSCPLTRLLSCVCSESVIIFSKQPLFHMSDLLRTV